MATRYHGDMTLFTVNSTDYIATLEGCDLEFPDNVIESSGISLLYEHEQVGGSGGKITATIKKAHGGGSNDFSCNLDVGALAIGGNTQLAYNKSGSLTISTTTKDVRGMGERWFKPKIVKKKIEMAGSFLLDSASNATEEYVLKHMSSTLTDKNVVATVTLDGTAYTFPSLLKSASLKIQDSDVQMVDFVLAGRSYADTPLTNMPTAPTGTTTLSEKAINTVAALTFEFETATTGVNFAGSLVITGLKISWGEDQLIKAEYTFETYGTVTTTRAT